MFLRTVGNRRAFAFMVLLPVAVISAIVMIFGQPPSSAIPIGYVNGDKGPLHEELMADLVSANEFRFVRIDNEADLRESVSKGTVSAGFIIPADYSDAIRHNGERYAVIVLENGSRDGALFGYVMQETAKRMENQFAAAVYDRTDRQQTLEDDLHRKKLQREPQPVITTTTADSGIRTNGNFHLIVGSLLLFIMILTNASIHVIMDDRDNKTMTRIYATPVKDIEVVLGYWIGCLALGTAQIALFLGLTSIVLQYDFGMPVYQLFIVLECFLLSSIGMGSAVGGLIKSKENLRFLGMNVTVITCLAGGCFWPLNAVPDFMRRLADFVPQKWAIDAVIRLTTGAGMRDVGMNIGILLLFAAVLLIFGSYLLKPGESETL